MTTLGSRLTASCLAVVMCPLAGDPNMRTLQKGEVLQLERKGYYVVDEPYGVKGPGRPMVLFAIPDGRSKNMTKGPAAAQ